MTSEQRPRPAPSQWPRTSAAGFTLMEVVLAITLTAVVVYLLTTAIELYLVSVDSSRSKVESAQVARTLLEQIADDLTAARQSSRSAFAPRGADSTYGQSASGGASTGVDASAGTDSPQGGGINPAFRAGNFGLGSMPGILGSIDQLRIDRPAYANWGRATRQVDLQETATAIDMPVTVRYFVINNDTTTPDELAAAGVGDSSLQTTLSGLYRETTPTASITTEPQLVAPTARPDANADLKLLAPEVVAMELSYFDGTDFVDQWDSVQAGGLPLGVEIRLTVAEPSPARANAGGTSPVGSGAYAENELVEYRRFVKLSPVQPGPPPQPLRTQSAEGQGAMFGTGNNGAGQKGAGSAAQGNNQ